MKRLLFVSAAAWIALAAVCIFGSDGLLQAQTGEPQQVAPDLIPQSGTFHLLSQPNLPPLPFLDPALRDLNVPVYWFGPDAAGNSFWVDDTSSAAALQEQKETDQALRSLEKQYGLDSPDSPPPPPGGGGGGSGSGGGSSYTQPDYGTNLWIAQVRIASGYLTGIASNTIADVEYEIQALTDLTQTNWVSQEFIVGSETTNWTPLTPLAVSRTNNVFLRIRSWADDGSGLPIWWQGQYFGTTGVDPYAFSPSGDGWTILQCYQNGWNPLASYTPPAPTGLAVNYHVAANSANISWDPSPGGVTSYLLERYDASSGLGQTNYYALPVSTNSFEDSSISQMSFSLWRDGPQTYYRLQAQYGATGSTWTPWVPLLLVDSSASAFLLRGPQGRPYLSVAGLPQDASTVRVRWVDMSGTSTNWVLPASVFTNGAYAVPDYWIPAAPASVNWYLDVLDSNGTLKISVVAFYYANSPYWGPAFFDGRQQLQQNLAFLLRAANASSPFQFQSMDPDDPYPFHDCPATYAYASVYNFSEDPPYIYATLDEFRPFEDNYLYRNFAFTTADTNGLGNLDTGAGGNPYDGYTLGYPSKYLFQPPATVTNIDPVLSPTGLPWTYFRDGYTTDANELALIGITRAGTTFTMARYAQNLFGLPFQSAKLANGTQTTTLSAGGTIPDNGGIFYPATAQPVLSTAEYYFAQTDNAWTVTPCPGTSPFSPTNTSPLLVAPVGYPFRIAGYAKQAITGCTDKYAYLGQYFQWACKLATNGVATTNQTGLLSEYGEFFPTEPGPAALITMTNWGVNERGTGVVQVIALCMDGNHDGVIDPSYFGPDFTSQHRPFVFWLNNNYDRFATDADDGVQYDDDVSSTSQDAKSLYTGKFTPDYDYTDALGSRIISCSRDLQDFARLWVCGVTSNLLTALPPGSTVTLSWGDVGNPNPANPTIDLFKAADPDGGIGYLTNSTTAFVQTLASSYPCIGRLGPGSNLVLNASQLNGWAGNYFIWCGVSNGTGALTLTISQGGTNTLAQTSAYIQLVDIKQMYERWTIGDFPNIPAYTNAIAAPDGLPTGISKFEYGASTDTNTPYILFVHGWNMEPWEKDRFAESAFKRLYWQGYQGRFGSFRWPTENGFKGISTMATNPSEKDNFDRSEYTAWRSGAALLNKLNDLNRQYPGHVYLLAHSMGNIVAGEALRLAGANQVVNTYVASQAAVSAHTYDTNIPNYSFYFSPWVYQCKTPNIYGNWFQGNYGGGAGTVVNFYNTNDFALQRSVWQLNQLFKPDQFVLMGGTHWDYSYNGMTNDPPPWNHFDKAVSLGFTIVDFDIVNVLTNRYEVMGLAAESWTTAFGATPGVQNIRRNVELPQLWPPDLAHPTHPFDEHFYHSAEFRGDYWQQQGYWRELLGSDAFKLK